MPWLLAMVATSTPALRRASYDDGGERKVKSLSCGVPRVVTAVSRFTIARSARRRYAAIGPNPPSARADAPTKCVSPPNAIVTGWVGIGVRDGDGGFTTVGGTDGVGVAPIEPDVEHPAKATAAVSARSSRRRIRSRPG